jgi:DNA repair exonuclease SbcCD nuclease subunit
MKILHCSDIHLGKRPFGNEKFSEKRYNDYFLALEELIEKAIEKKIDVFMIGGDLFDKREITPDILGKCEILFQRLILNGIKILITEGNHDNSNRYDSIDSWLNYLQERGLAKRLSYERTEKNKYFFDVIKIEEVNFYGLGYPGFNIDNVIKALSEQLDSNEKNVVLVHTAIGNSENSALPGLIKTETLNLLKNKVLYVGGGHYHSKSTYPSEKSGEKPFFFVPGSTEYWNVLNEKTNEKGAFIFDTESKEYEFVLLSPRKRIREKFNVETSQEIEEKFKEFVQTLQLTGEELVVIELLISDYSYINNKELEKILEEMGALKGYVVPVFLKGDRDEESFEGTPATAEEIEMSLISQWEGFANSSLGKNFRELKEIQREKDEFERFYELFDKILEGVIEDENKKNISEKL